MPGVISRGKTFGATEEVTNTKLHQLVDNATISGIDPSNMASGTGAITRSTSAPSNTDGIWVDTNQSPPVVKRYTGSEWQPIASFAVLTNKSGGSVAAGDVVVADTTTDGSFTTSASGSDIKVLGVAMESIASNADGVIALAGARVTNINCSGAVTRGQFLKTHTVAKQAVATSTGDAGVFAIALSSLGGSGALGEALLLGCNLAGAFTPTAANALSGSVIQEKNGQTASVITISTALAQDNSIPQDAETVEITSVSITPNHASNLLHVVGSVTGAAANAGTIMGLCIFNGTTCVSADWNQSYSTSAENSKVEFWVAAGGTSAITFKLKAGVVGSFIYYVNGDGGGTRIGGGVCFANITVTEIKA